jgi:hypothetical protein
MRINDGSVQIVKMRNICWKMAQGIEFSIMGDEDDSYHLSENSQQIFIRGSLKLMILQYTFS